MILLQQLSSLKSCEKIMVGQPGAIHYGLFGDFHEPNDLCVESYECAPSNGTTSMFLDAKISEIYWLKVWT